MRNHEISGLSRKTRISKEFYPIVFEEGGLVDWKCARERAKLYKNTPKQILNKGFHKLLFWVSPLRSIKA